MAASALFKILEGFKGDPWPKTWFTRFGGAVLAVLTVLVALSYVTIH